MRRLSWIALIALLAACSRTETQAGAPGKTGSTADRQLTEQVRTAMTADATLSAQARSISVTAENGVVTLRGTVTSNEEADRVEALAKAVKGVVRVDDQLEVRDR